MNTQEQSNSKVLSIHLASIKRNLLDFDFQKVCCSTLSTNNVYGCLVCGRYFQGKSISSPAYQHSIEYSHHIFINLSNSKIYSLPDNEEIESQKLADIKFNLNPTYQEEDLNQLYKFQPKYNIDGKQYISGIIGINNLKGTDYANSVFQILNSIKPIREYFLINTHFQDPFLQQFGIFIRKIWNPKQFKGTISPHELLQIISEKSNKVFKIGKSSDPVNFITWMIDNLQKLSKKQKHKKGNFTNLFQGALKTSHFKGIKNSSEYEPFPSKVEQKAFTIIRLEFPQRGIFNKVQNEVHINNMLEYYLGTKGKVQGQGLLYIKITHFPEYLILVYKRFHSNEFQTDKDASNVLYTQNLQIQDKKYRLIGQICHYGTHETGTFKAHILMGDKWFMAEDLTITQILKKQMLLGQPYIQIYKKS